LSRLIHPVRMSAARPFRASVMSSAVEPLWRSILVMRRAYAWACPWRILLFGQTSCVTVQPDACDPWTLPSPAGTRPWQMPHGFGNLFLMFLRMAHRDRKSTRLNSSHVKISYAVFCLKKKNRRLLLQGLHGVAASPTAPP